ncbi:hypothetical protein [Bartonella taylorii]|nr:hypothetical protein [Bartonella taylorii]
MAKCPSKTTLDAHRHGFCSWLVKTLDVSYEGAKSLLDHVGEGAK